MSNFWQTSTGESVQQTGSFEAGGGELKPIPEDTSVMSSAEEASWKEYQGIRHISLKWRVAKPEQYANRVVFQKLHVNDPDPLKADRAKQMLAAIATNAGGALFQAMQKAREHEPSDASLSTLCNRPMVQKLGIWELSGKSGNYVKAVSPVKSQTPAPAQVAAPKPAPVNDDDIPW